MEKAYLDADEVAEYISVSKLTIYDWACHGKIPSKKIHGCLRFPKKLIDEWLESFTLLPLDFKKRKCYNQSMVRGGRSNESTSHPE